MTAVKKKCSKCGDEKSLYDFSPDKRRTLGRQSSCKQCMIDWKTANKEAVAKSQQKSGKKKRMKWPEKEKAKHAVNYAIKMSKITKPDYCENCFAKGRVEGHHEEYSKLLDVKWLCRRCHFEVHNKSRVYC